MILITGGTGFVGGHLIRCLRQGKVPVRAIVRSPNKAQTLKDLGVEVVAGDISNSASLDKAAAGVERVIHLVGIIQEAPGVTFRKVHVEGTRNVLDAAKKAGVRHFFYQSAELRASTTRPNGRQRSLCERAASRTRSSGLLSSTARGTCSPSGCRRCSSCPLFCPLSAQASRRSSPFILMMWSRAYKRS